MNNIKIIRNQIKQLKINEFMPRLRKYGIILVLVVLLGAIVATYKVTKADEVSFTSPNPAELNAYMTAYHLTSKVAYYLDQLSNTTTTDEENSILAKIRPLLTPDITVITDGRTFSGIDNVLEGMRIVHARQEHGAKRLETSPAILNSGLEGSPQTFTITTVQQEWWTNPSTAQLLMSNRNTEVTIEKVNDQWLISKEVLQTVTGPIPH